MTKIKDVRIVRASDSTDNELFVGYFTVYKPEDTKHLKPRTVLNMLLSNEPAKEVFHRQKDNDGHLQAARLMTP